MINSDVLFFFEKMPDALPLFETLEKRLVQTVGEYTTRVQKTQIAYTNRHVFTCVSFLKVRKARQRPRAYIVVTFGLNRKVESPRIDAAVEVYPGRWTHHVLISRQAEVDDELMSWIQEAYWFAAAK